MGAYKLGIGMDAPYCMGIQYNAYVRGFQIWGSRYDGEKTIFSFGHTIEFPFDNVFPLSFSDMYDIMKDGNYPPGTPEMTLPPTASVYASFAKFRYETWSIPEDLVELYYLDSDPDELRIAYDSEALFKYFTGNFDLINTNEMPFIDVWFSEYKHLFRVYLKIDIEKILGDFNEHSFDKSFDLANYISVSDFPSGFDKQSLINEHGSNVHFLEKIDEENGYIIPIQGYGKLENSEGIWGSALIESLPNELSPYLGILDRSIMKYCFVTFNQYKGNDCSLVLFDMEGKEYSVIPVDTTHDGLYMSETAMSDDDNIFIVYGHRGGLNSCIAINTINGDFVDLSSFNVCEPFVTNDKTYSISYYDGTSAHIYDKLIIKDVTTSTLSQPAVEIDLDSVVINKFQLEPIYYQILGVYEDKIYVHFDGEDSLYVMSVSDKVYFDKTIQLPFTEYQQLNNWMIHDDVAYFGQSNLMELWSFDFSTDTFTKLIDLPFYWNNISYYINGDKLYFTTTSGDPINLYVYNILTNELNQLPDVTFERSGIYPQQNKWSLIDNNRYIITISSGNGAPESIFRSEYYEVDPQVPL